MAVAPHQPEKHLLRAMFLSPDCVMIHVARTHLQGGRGPEFARVTAMLFDPLAQDPRTGSYPKIPGAQCTGDDLPDPVEAHLTAWPGMATARAVAG